MGEVGFGILIFLFLISEAVTFCVRFQSNPSFVFVSDISSIASGEREVGFMSMSTAPAKSPLLVLQTPEFPYLPNVVVVCPTFSSDLSFVEEFFFSCDNQIALLCIVLAILMAILICLCVEDRRRALR